MEIFLNRADEAQESELKLQELELKIKKARKRNQALRTLVEKMTTPQKGCS